ncbi:hypothetical protein B0H15DRAFT_831171 [Mycena belliarum]|uniref:ABM domain-containing protein n=1 Tax=Mycena belliarum TaxID=1033014 RepID=A0AAD6XUJ4_9AGAR|nr:hypothetical protein B0H15DRAFT_831171 [Mycena belliae]
MVYTIVAHLYAKEGKDVEEQIRGKLVEASAVYLKDAGTISWFVMQDAKDPRAWSIIERYEKESSLEIHIANPYFKTWFEFMKPLLAKEIDIRRSNELE